MSLPVEGCPQPENEEPRVRAYTPEQAAALRDAETKTETENEHHE